jgi:hypothetical protein
VGWTLRNTFARAYRSRFPIPYRNHGAERTMTAILFIAIGLAYLIAASYGMTLLPGEL